MRNLIQAKTGTIDNCVRAAIYTRLSDEDKDKVRYSDLSESIKNQIALAEKHAQERGWNIVGVYSDDDWSGLDKDRPEFNRLLRDCQEGKIDIVLCKDMSRFTRDKIVTEEYLETRFPEWNVRFIGLTDGSDTADKGNKKSREINALVNQWYAEDISNKVRAAFKTKREAGSFIGSFAPYGYIKSTTVKGRLEIDLAAAEVVKRIFVLYLSGLGTHSIALLLNKDDIPNPTAYKESKYPNYKNVFKKDNRGLWSKTSVKRILRNEAYIGNMVQHKNEKLHFKTKRRRNLPREAWEIVEGTHEPIIDVDTFFKVQKLLNSKVRSTGEGTPHLFAGTVVCKDCGSPMVKSSNNGYCYLTCSGYRADQSICSRHSIRLDMLTDAVEHRIRELLFGLLQHKEKFLTQLVENDGFAPMFKMANIKVQKVMGRIKEVTEALKALYVDKCQGKIDTFIFNDIKNEFIQEKNKLDKQLVKLREELAAAKGLNNRVIYWSTVLDKWAKSPALTREIINELINRVEIGEKGDGFQEIVIYYNFTNCV